jgi:Zn-dependent protease with chaperone function
MTQSHALEGVPSVKRPVSEPRPVLTFPPLISSGPKVNANNHIAEGTGPWTAIGYLVTILVGLVTVISTMGAALIFGFIGLLIGYMTQKRVFARLKGSHLQITPQQLGEVHACARELSTRLGLSHVPDIFVVETSELNAVTFKLFARKAVLVTDDLLWGALHCQSPHALRFIIAHELAHHALGHTGLFRRTVASTFRPLARLDELSADRVALQLVGDREVAYEGLMLLTVGPQLLPYVNRTALLQQAMEVGQDKRSKKSEAGMTHPLTLRRLYELRNVSRAG